MSTPDFETPIMPTGSGVADLEIAREQDALANGIAADDVVPTADAPPETESAAHPS